MIENVTALRCNPFDPLDIAQRIDYLLSREDRIDEIGANAREFISRYYDWEERARVYPGLFEAAVQGDLEALSELPLVVSLGDNEFAKA